MMRTLVETGLSNALAATVLALAVATIGRICRRPALLHSLWIIVLLKLVAPPLWPVHLGLFPAAAETVATSPPARSSELVAARLPVVLIEEVPLDVTEIPAVPEAPPPPSRSESPAAMAMLAVNWRSLVAGVWLIGCGVWLAWALARVVRFRRAMRGAEPAPYGLRVLVDKLAQRLGLAEAPEVGVVPGAVSPLVWTLGGRPLMLVPAELWERLDDDQRATLLIHELAHLRRRDHWVRVLELVVTGLYWWHPIVWWARRALRDAEEQCCDAWVVWARPGAAKAYATALLETVDFLSEARSPLPLAASGIGHVDHLKRRLTMIFSGMTPKGLSWAGRLTVFALACALLPLAPAPAQDAPAPPPPPTVLPPAGAQIVELRGEALPSGVETVVVGIVDDDDEKDKDKDKGKKTDEDPTGDKTKARAELDKARAELKAAEEQLAKAAKRVAELQGRVHARRPGETGHWEYRTDDGRVVIVERRGPDGPAVVHENFRMTLRPGEVSRFVTPVPAVPGAPAEIRSVPPVPPMPPGVGASPNSARARVFTRSLPGADYEKRMRDLEQKLDKLMDEIKDLRKERPSASKPIEREDFHIELKTSDLKGN
jgi:beta-lactamase regulating signal transducer with metallopeptidase domain